ncbi:MAG: RagB/SusD family nutrient uptake outer membrane protein [Cyclobacteriaceae bacterium]
MINKYLNKTWMLALGFSALLVSCDLDIEETDSIITEESSGTFTGVPDTEAAVNDLYNSLRGHLEAQDNYFALQEVSTDELLVPTRGTDWGDNGIWRTLHAHTWSPSHAYVLNVWNQFNQNIFRATEIIDSRSGASPEEAANAKFVRAYSMWIILDLYGQVPFREPDEAADVNPTVLTRAEALSRVITDLDEAIAALPTAGPGAGLDRASKAAANFLKARVLLNAHIYDGTGTPSPANMTAVVAAVDAIEADGFALQEGFFELFEADEDAETIWWVPASTGNNMWNGLHYNQIVSDNTGGGWNGFSTLAEFYDTFEGSSSSNAAGSDQEERRGFVPTLADADPETNLGIGFGFLVGQQVGPAGFDDDGNPTSLVELKDRPGNPLVFTKELPGLVGNNERTGIRVLKYHPSNGAFAGHKIIFRYADAHLMRAEAMMNGAAGDALAEVNELRDLRDASDLSSISAAEMLNERGRELYMEYIRRTDMIRFGQYGRNWQFKDPGSVDVAERALYPVPSNALLSNPNLVQNPGY